MKRIWLTSVIALVQLAGQAALADGCVEPAAFNAEIPSGASASREAMLATQHAIKAYDNAVKAYSDCLRDEGDTTHRADATVQKLEQLASHFNDQLKVFKERNGAT